MATEVPLPAGLSRSLNYSAFQSPPELNPLLPGSRSCFLSRALSDHLQPPKSSRPSTPFQPWSRYVSQPTLLVTFIYLSVVTYCIVPSSSKATPLVKARQAPKPVTKSTAHTARSVHKRAQAKRVSARDRVPCCGAEERVLVLIQEISRLGCPERCTIWRGGLL